jgi:opacity protein-like surface antigen
MFRSGPVIGGLVAIGASILPCLGYAQDGGVRLIFGIENRLEAFRNEELSVPATGTTIENVTRLSFGLISETAVDRLEFAASGAMIVEDSDESSGTDIDFGRSAVTLAYRREVPSSVFDIAAEFRNDDVDAFVDDLGDGDESGTRTNYNLSARLEVGRTSSVGFALGLAYENTDFQDATDPTLEDSEELRGDAAVIFHFSEAATGRIGLRFTHREEDDAAETVTETTVAFAGLDYAVSERLDLTLELGYAESEEDEFGITSRTSGPDATVGLTYDMPVGTATARLRVTTDIDEGQRETFEIGRDIETPLHRLSARLGVTHADTAGSDLIGALRWDRALPDGSLGVDIERRVRFDADDDETVTDSVFSLSWTKNVNAVSSISLDVSYEHSDAPSEQIEQTTFGVAYRHQLTEAWTFNSGIGYRLREDADGHSESPNVFVALSRDFEFRP